MRNIINYSTIIFSFALAASFLSSTLAIDLKLKNYNESLIGFSLSFFALGVIVSSFLHNIIREKYSLFFTLICSILIQLLFFLLLFFQTSFTCQQPPNKPITLSISSNIFHLSTSTQ